MSMPKRFGYHAKRPFWLFTKDAMKHVRPLYSPSNHMQG